MTKRLIAPAALALVSAMLFVAPAHAAPACTTTINPGQPIQSAITNAGPNAVVCFTAGTFAPTNPIVLPGAMTVVGIGSPPPVIECAGRTYCINATTGPSNVDLENLILQGASKADVQIGKSGGATVTGWTISGITTRGAGEVGLTMNGAADVTISNSTFSANGSAPYDVNLNPTGDFGLRAVRVDGLTVQNSTFSDNVTIPIATSFANAGFAGGAKFNTDTNLTVTGNTFTGNAGGGQLWIDIDSQDFDVTSNTIQETPNATTSALPAEAIRVEVSCGATNGSTIANNTVQAGTTAGIDLFDANHVQVQQNQVSTTQPGSFGIRMYGNAHNAVPGNGCDSPADVYPNTNNIATGNTISLTASATAQDGVVNDVGGISTGNVWSANTYVVRHCTGAKSANWAWWDGSLQQSVGFADWQRFGQDAAPAGTCTSTFPRIDSFTPTAGQIGTPVTIQGSGFTGTTGVQFKGVQATQFHVDSDAQITASVPPGATSGQICLVTPNPGGCSGAADPFTVQPAATVTRITPDSGVQGTVVAVAGTSLTSATGATFAGIPADAFAVVSDSEVDVTAPAGVVSGPVCVLMPAQPPVCASTPFTVPAPIAPTITSPSTTFELAPFLLSWGPVPGADSYLAQWHSAPYNSGYKPVWTQQSTTGTSLSFPANPGQTTCFQVTAQAASGSATSGLTCTAVPLDDRGLTVSGGTWTEPTGARFFQGTATVSQRQNASLTLVNVAAKTVALVVETQPNGGNVDVLLNGVVIATVSTASPTVRDQQVVPVASWNALRKGTITLRVATAGKPVAIDGLGLYRG